MRIREATNADEPALGDELLRPSYRASKANAPSFNELDEAALAEADAGRWLDHDDRVLFVAEADDQLVGHVSGLLTEPPPIYDRGDEAHVDGLYVKPDYRRQGVADALLDRIEAWARAEGCAYIGVTVHAANEAAKSLYDDRFELRFHSYRERLD